MRRLLVVGAMVGAGLLVTLGSAFAVDYPAANGGLIVMQGGQAVTTVAPGSSVEVFGSGFAPGAAVAIDIASTPTLLTTATADATGRTRGFVRYLLSGSVFAKGAGCHRPLVLSSSAPCRAGASLHHQIFESPFRPGVGVDR